MTYFDAGFTGKYRTSECLEWKKKTAKAKVDLREKFVT